jgi:ferredoxin
MDVELTKTIRRVLFMSTDIYYFSGTGNSLHIARELQKRIPETNLIPIVSLLNQDVIESSGETVGLIFPVYLSTIPVPVKRFLKKLNLKQSKYIFAVATRGGSLSIANIHIEKILKKKSRSLDSYFILNMVNNTPTGLMPTYMPGAKDIAKDWVNQISREKTSSLETEVQNRLDLIQKVIINQEKNPEKGSFLEHLIAFLMVPAENANEHSKTKINYYSDPHCTGCGTCEKVCLSKKIKIINKKPVWQNDVQCYFCYACFNSCPVQSILIKNSYNDKNGRYLHPEITVNDIAEQK